MKVALQAYILQPHPCDSCHLLNKHLSLVKVRNNGQVGGRDKERAGKALESADTEGTNGKPEINRGRKINARHSSSRERERTVDEGGQV